MWRSFRVCLFICGYIGPKFGCADSRSGTPVSCRDVCRQSLGSIQIVGLLGVGTYLTAFQVPATWCCQQEHPLISFLEETDESTRLTSRTRLPSGGGPPASSTLHSSAAHNLIVDAAAKGMSGPGAPGVEAAHPPLTQLAKDLNETQKASLPIAAHGVVEGAARGLNTIAQHIKKQDNGQALLAAAAKIGVTAAETTPTSPGENFSPPVEEPVNCPPQGCGHVSKADSAKITQPPQPPQGAPVTKCVPICMYDPDNKDCVCRSGEDGPDCSEDSLAVKAAHLTASKAVQDAISVVDAAKENAGAAKEEAAAIQEGGKNVAVGSDDKDAVAAKILGGKRTL